MIQGLKLIQMGDVEALSCNRNDIALGKKLLIGGGNRIDAHPQMRGQGALGGKRAVGF